MSPTAKAIVWGAVATFAVLAAGAAVWLAASPFRGETVSGYAATRPTPLLDPPPRREAVREIRIAADRSVTTLARAGDGWVVRELADYPVADMARVDRLIERLSALTGHFRASGAAPEPSPVAPTEVTVATEAAAPVRLSFGNPLTVPGEQDRRLVPVRRDAGDAWLTDFGDAPDPHPTAWTGSALLDLPRERVRSARIDVAGAGGVRIERRDAGLGIAVDGRDDAGVGTTPAELSVVLAALENLAFSEARRPSATPDAGAADRSPDARRSATFETVDGLVVRVDLHVAGREPWAMLAIDATPDAPDAVRAEARALAARMGGREYLLDAAILSTMVDWPDRLLAR
ncbi:MAG: hypothetical protein AB7N54_15460 [Alphaproteobacteria bacterium]